MKTLKVWKKLKKESQVYGVIDTAEFFVMKPQSLRSFVMISGSS